MPGVDDGAGSRLVDRITIDVYETCTPPVLGFIFRIRRDSDSVLNSLPDYKR